MISKTVIGLTAFAVLAVGLLTPAMADFVSGIGVDSISVNQKNKNTSTLTVDATSTIPKHTSDLGGFAWLYVDGSPHTAFVTATHEGVRDSHQNPDGWHAHNVILGGGTTNSDACITEIVDDPRAGISIKGDIMNANIRNSQLTGELSGLGAAFEITIDSDCDITIPTADIVPGGLRLGVNLQ